MADETDLGAMMDAAHSAAPAPPSPGGGSPPDAAASPADDALGAAMESARNPAMGAAAPAPAGIPRHAGPGQPSRYQQAVLTGPDDTQKYADMPWSEVGKSAIKNALPSLGGQAKAAWNAVTHPKDTLGSLQELGGGLSSKVQGWFGANQDPQQKAKNEAVLDALLHHYGTAYGSMAGFKKELATDPASVAMDASTVFGGAGAAAKAANLGKLGAGLSTVGRVVDPIAGAVKAAKLAAYPAVKVGRFVQGMTTGVPGDGLKTAALAGSAGTDPALRDAFLRHYRGTASPDESLSAMSSAFDKLRSQTLANLQNDKRLSYANAPGAMPFTKIDAALAKAKAELGTAGAPPSWKADKVSALKDAEDWVNYHKANPSMQTMAKFDDLRKEIGDLGWANNNARIKETVQPVYQAIRDTMKDVSPEYTDVLERTTQAQRDMKDMARSLGVNAYDKGTAMGPTLIARQLRQMTSEHGRDMLSKVSEIDPRIPYMLAGIATHEFAPKGLRHVLGGAGLSGGAALLASPGAWPAVAGAAALGAATASPKVAGALHYGYGSLDRWAGSPKVKAAVYVGRANELADQSQPDQSADFDNKSLPRNARNHNFGNIKDGQFAKRQVGYAGSDGTFARFDTPENGAKATKNLIRHYLRSGRDTPDRFAGDWAKGGENTDEDRAMYGAQIASALGVNHDSKIPYGDEDAVSRIFHAIARHEGSDLPEPEGEGETSRSKHAKGGKVQIDHAGEAATLIRRAERAKNQLGKTTEPLLNTPDDHIAKALAVANESI